MLTSLKYVTRSASNNNCYIAGVFPATANPFIGYFMVTWRLTTDETVSRQMPWAGNIAKTMTSNGKQSTVTREMLTAVARDRWNLSAVFKFCFCFVLLYNKSLNDWCEFCFPRISMFHLTSSRETLRFSGNKIHCSPRDQSLRVNY